MPQAALCGQGHGDINGTIHQHRCSIAAEQVDAEGCDWGQVVPGAVSWKQEAFFHHMHTKERHGAAETALEKTGVATSIYRAPHFPRARDCMKHHTHNPPHHLPKVGKNPHFAHKEKLRLREGSPGGRSEGVGRRAGIQVQVAILTTVLCSQKGPQKGRNCLQRDRELGVCRNP